MLSTEATAEMVLVQSSNSHIAPTTKPAVVNAYNQNMNGIDVSDQLGMYYSFQHKTVKWWRKVFSWLLEITVINSFIIYRQTTATPKTHLIYHRSLVKVLATRCISSTHPRPRVGRPRKRCHPDSPERLNGHFHQLERREKQQDCIVCSKQSEGVRFRTYFYCNTCTTKATLHPGVCYNRYHTMTNYKR